MKILNFGSCNIDYVYSLDHIVNPGETQKSDGMNIFPGGKGLNQSIACARAGAKVYHAGCIGEDGGFLVDIMNSSGVDTSLINFVSGKNGHAIIQVNKAGENSIFLYGGSNELITKDYIDSVLEQFDAEDILLLQNEINNVDYIVKKAGEKKMCIVLNPSPFNEKVSKIDFKYLSYLILNEGEAKDISGCNTSDDAIKFLNQKYPNLKIILTLGSKGSIFYDGNKSYEQSAFKVKAVDTTAAGDTYTGYFVAGLASGADCVNILKSATSASAISVTKNGAAPSIPVAEDVKKFLETLGE